jgi:hypothetical protein
MYYVTMAEQMFMYAVTAGFMIGLGVILGISRTRRPRTSTTEVPTESSYSPSSSPSSSSGESHERRRIKRYNSDGKPVYE